ncbi:MAG: PTS system mannose/fructose/sorbose family transporter subunit IID [Deltaproteobacteria bacterium]|nr:PTS system mannose/fructose/sorbose family transporter subunit IID [Candidatus Anaeroferrophillus wilburensis]MBN2889467.1 PTS system mannose/fructose/sorbose family transporter subunit IID [Deltaproteobacteria bacterium]
MHLRITLEQRIFLRSLCWQASWNFGRMQNMGLAYAIYPLLQQRYDRQRQQLCKALSAYLGFFNTNPVMAAAVLGILVHLEKRGEGQHGMLIARNLNSLYGAVGDAFFWNGLKPAMALLAVIIYFAGGGFWAPLLLLAGYNAVHLGIRYTIYTLGVHHGLEVINTIHYWRLPKVKLVMSYGIVIMMAAIIPLMFSTLQPVPGCPISFFLLLIGGIYLCSHLLARGIALPKLFYGSSLFVASVIIGYRYWFF